MAKEKQYWLMKSEPNEYSIDDLKRDKKSGWFGVRNYQARNYMRDAMQIGDLILFYHSSVKEPAVVGIGKVASAPYPDKTQFEKSGKYFEKRATKEKPVWLLVDISYVKKFINPVLLSSMRADKKLKDMVLLKRGMRLSIQPVAEKEFLHIESLGTKK